MGSSDTNLFNMDFGEEFKADFDNMMKMCYNISDAHGIETVTGEKFADTFTANLLAAQTDLGNYLVSNKDIVDSF